MASLGPQMLGAQRGRDIQEMLSQAIYQGLLELGTDVEWMDFPANNDALR